MAKRIDTYLSIVGHDVQVVVAAFREQGAPGLMVLGKLANDLGAAVRDTAMELLGAHPQVGYVGVDEDSLTIYTGMDISALAALITDALVRAKRGEYLPGGMLIRSAEPVS